MKAPATSGFHRTTIEPVFTCLLARRGQQNSGAERVARTSNAVHFTSPRTRGEGVRGACRRDELSSLFTVILKWPPLLPYSTLRHKGGNKRIDFSIALQSGGKL